MIKVVIVEDKPPILWSIKQKVQNYSAELKVVGEAYNGQEALRLIEGLKPDIVFTDIRMPVMDGLELISQVKKLQTDTHFVIISGYDEFEYARQAMKLGVSDYILKPITQEAIDDVLSKIVGDIQARVSQDEKRLLQDLLNCGKNIDFEKQAFSYRYFITAIICAGSYSNQAIDYTNPFNFIGSKVNYDETVSKHLPLNVFYWSFAGKNLNEMVLLFGVSDDVGFDLSRVIESIGSDLSALNTPITIAVSKRISNVNNIGIETQNTRALLRKNLIFGRSGIIYSDSARSGAAENLLFLDSSLEKKLFSLVQGNQRELFFNEIRKIISNFEQSSSTQYNIENSLKYITHICNRAAIDRSDFSNSLELEVEEVLSISKDYKALLQGLSSIFGQFFTVSSDLRQKREPLKEIIDTVENYIKANFAKQITINDIADMVKVDPCHLSKTFKSVKGISPMEYLTNLRIEKSKELILNDPGLMLRDIAEIVGYTNQYYFSRIFKTVTGLSPSEFKSSR